MTGVDHQTIVNDLAGGENSPPEPLDVDVESDALAEELIASHWNESGNYELRSAMEQAELRRQQDDQSALATHRRTP